MPRLLVSVYTRTDTRSKVLGHAMLRGIKELGDTGLIVPTSYWDGAPRNDVAMFYAFKGSCREIMAEYLKAGKHVVYMDKGYFGEKPPGRDHYSGFHRFAIDALHPTPGDVGACQIPVRFKHHRITPSPRRRKGEYILLAGMSPNQARNAAYSPNEWEEKALKRLNDITQRPIIYRPKPSWADAPLLPGTIDGRKASLSELLSNCHVTVSHHSNVAIDGLLQGVPGVVETGPAAKICPDGGQIEDPYFPDKTELRDFLWGLSWWQWNRDEMRSGEAWKFLREKLI